VGPWFEPRWAHKSATHRIALFHFIMKEFKNIIFDFGGVILNIDYHRVIDSFTKLGAVDFEKIYSQLNQLHLFDDYDKGLISSDEFRQKIRSITNLAISDSQIDEAWNAILIDLPKENIELLHRLKKSYRLFLLSNTNEIHEKAFTKLMFDLFGKNVLTDIFERIYFSHQVKQRKPDIKIFQTVINENNLIAGETLFIDDSPQHIEGAKQAGLQTLFLKKGQRIADIFR
jgi:glucose-1-phosphatase